MTVIPLQGTDVNILRRDTGKLSDEYSSSSSSSSSTSSATSSGSTIVGPYVTPGGGSTTIYLIALLITIIVLAGISAALVFRAYYMRRRLSRAMQESVRTGQPLPAHAAAALGIFRPDPYAGARRGGRLGKEVKHVGAMPSMWEGEMYRDIESGWEKDEEEDSLLEKKGKDGSWSGDEWDDIDPLTLVHLTPPAPAPPPELLAIPQFEIPSYFRALFISTRPRPIPPNTTYHSIRGNRGRGVNGTQGEGAVGTEEIPKAEPNWTIPPPGEEMLLGVMIAMPTQGKGEELWETEGMEAGEERDLPNVELGVISAKMGEY